MSSWPASNNQSGSSPRSKMPSDSKSPNDQPSSPPQVAVTTNSTVPRTDPRSFIPSDPLRKSSTGSENIVTHEAALGFHTDDPDEDTSKISAYARLDFDNYTFFVQTLQVLLGRKANDDNSAPSHHAVDVHLGFGKAISRRHAKIFYNFGTQRFEISILGRNGAFVDDSFVEKGITVPLIDGTKIQIGDIPFTFVLPSIAPKEADEQKSNSKPINPTDALNLRTNLYSNSASPTREERKKNILSTEQKENEPKLQRRSSKADMVRRLSNARRKSVASSTNDEITSLLRELETIGDDENTDALDAEVNELLSKGELRDDNEENEIDELVKQHSAQPETAQPTPIPEQGKHSASPTPAASNDDVEISIIDQEIASLAPLINAQTDDVKVGADATKGLDSQGKPSAPDPNDLSLHRSGPLMGKPAARMGKAASVQPPAGRSYGRQSVSSLYSSATYPGQAAASTLPRTATTHSFTVPQTAAQSTISSALPPSVNNSALPISSASGGLGAPGTNPALSYSAQGPSGSYPAYYSPYGVYPNGLPANLYQSMSIPPPPMVVVPVDVITSVPVRKSSIPYKAITTKDAQPARPPICVFKTLDEPSSVPKIPIRKKDGLSKKAAAKNVSKTAPEQFKTKPTLSLSTMVSVALRGIPPETSGLTFNEIHEKIKQLYPYYYYAPDGWQSLVNHNIKFNKMFKRVFKAGLESEHLWAIDDEYISEKERVRKKQQDMAMAKAKEAALKAVDLRQRQKAEVAHYNLPYGRSFVSPYGSPPYSSRYPMSASPPAPGGSPSMSVQANQKPKSIAEIASEIKREVSTPGGRSTTPVHRSGYSPPASAAPVDATSSHEVSHSSTSNIKEQLAANRSRSASQTNTVEKPSGKQPSASASPAASGTMPVTNKPAAPAKPLTMNADTKKSLAYLQKELFTLYKARKLSYDTATTTDIITKALATTIAQVNIIGAKAGCGDNSLSFLVEKAPQQVSKILDIALSKSIKELDGSSSKAPSKEGTPMEAVASPQPQKPASSASSILRDTTPAAKASTQSPPPAPQAPSQSPKPPSASQSQPQASSPAQASPANANGPSRPAYSGLSRPHFSGLSRPPSMAKPGAFSKPPQFISNKIQPQKRSSDDDSENQSKAVKLE